VNAIKNGITDREAITNSAYSAAFLFRLVAPKDLNCQGSSSLMAALRTQKETGNLPIADVSESCITEVSEAQIQKAASGKIKDYARLFDIESPAASKIFAVKKSLSENRPVVMGMICPPSFDGAKEIWKPTEQADRKLYGGHAMCVVGYDDNKDGGSFEIQNSWGLKWGNGGYIWINYETFAAFTLYGFEIK
jgi:C1A family cysteine protease